MGPKQKTVPVGFLTQYGEYSGVDSESEDDTEKGDEEGSDNKKSTKGNMMSGKKCNTDLQANEVIIQCHFYESETGPTNRQLALPKLPPVKTDVKSETIDDYRDFKNKLSTWFGNSTNRKWKPSLAKNAPVPKRKFPCTKCDWSFETVAKLSRHKEVHRNPGVFVCQVCFTIFGHEYNLYNHWRLSCTQVSTFTTDAFLKVGNISELRKLVLCAMGAENRAQQFHVFGGAIYIPSQWFTKNKYNIVHPNHQSPCHLCHITVPTKFLECHGDVHRGRYRIDGKIYEEYFCHICGTIFTHRDNLITHWRHQCPEIMIYTPEDIYLDNDELTALAWLYLQTVIPRDQIAAMAKHSRAMIENRMLDHAAKNGLIKVQHLYHHYPQEICPLPFRIGSDIVIDSIPIVGSECFVRQSDNDVDINNPKHPVHIVNLLAMAAPDFYATGMTFHEICETTSEEATKIFKIILRYTTAGSIISTYKINAHTCPVLRSGKLASSKFSAKDFDVDSSYQAKQSDGEKFASTVQWPSFFRFREIKDRSSHSKKGLRHCPLCNRVVGSRCLQEHWQNVCVPIKAILTATERKFVDERLASSIKTCLSKFYYEIQYDWKRRPEPKTEMMKETMDRIGEYHQLIFHISAACLKKLQELIKKDVVAAERRCARIKDGAENFQPTEAPMICCVHCGGRFHHLHFFTHLEKRHFYPPANDLDTEMIQQWRNNKCANTYNFLTVLSKRANFQTEMMWMSEEHYDMCVASFTDTVYNTINESLSEPKIKSMSNRNKINEPWNYDTTTRELEILDPLIIDDIKQNEKKGVPIVVAPEPMDKTVFYTKNVQKLSEISGLQADIMQQHGGDRAIYRLLTFEENPVDLMTKEDLPEDTKLEEMEHSRHLYSDIFETRLGDAIAKHSASDFCQAPLGGSKGHRDGEESEEEAENDDEFPPEEDNHLYEEGEDDGVSRPKRLRMQSISQVETVYPSEIDDVDQEEETIESVMYRRAMKKQEYTKKRQNTCIEKQPQRYNGRSYVDLNISIAPDIQQELGFLNPVRRDVKEVENLPNHREDEHRELKEEQKKLSEEKGMNALSRKFENCLSEIRLSAHNFYRYGENYLNKPASSIPLDRLSENDLEESITFEQFLSLGAKPCPVTLRYGDMQELFVEGYVLNSPPDQSIGETDVIHIARNDYCRKYFVCNCGDTQGKFKWYWPFDSSNEYAIAVLVPSIRRVNTEMEKYIHDIRSEQIRSMKECELAESVPRGEIVVEELGREMRRHYTRFLDRKNVLTEQGNPDEVATHLAWKHVYDEDGLSEDRREYMQFEFRTVCEAMFREQEKKKTMKEKKERLLAPIRIGLLEDVPATRLEDPNSRNKNSEIQKQRSKSQVARLRTEIRSCLLKEDLFDQRVLDEQFSAYWHRLQTDPNTPLYTGPRKRFDFKNDYNNYETAARYDLRHEQRNDPSAEVHDEPQLASTSSSIRKLQEDHSRYSGGPNFASHEATYEKKIANRGTDIGEADVQMERIPTIGEDHFQRREPPAHSIPTTLARDKTTRQDLTAERFDASSIPSKREQGQAPIIEKVLQESLKREGTQMNSSSENIIEKESNKPNTPPLQDEHPEVLSPNEAETSLMKVASSSLNASSSTPGRRVPRDPSRIRTATDPSLQDYTKLPYERLKELKRDFDSNERKK